MPHDVFVSYASADRIAADAVCAALESRGIRCWIAPRDVPAGADWGEAILSAIGRAHAMVLILSRQTAGSTHVRNEVVTAVSQSLALVPVRVEDCQPGGALRLHLAGAHWLNIFPPPVDQHAEALAAGVRLALAADATVEIPRAQAAALVAAARAGPGGAGAAQAGRPATPAMPRPAEARRGVVPSAAAAPAAPPRSAGAAAGRTTAAAVHDPAAPRRQNRTALIVALLAVLLLAALGAAAWMLEPQLRARLLGSSGAQPVATQVATAEPAVPEEEPPHAGLGSAAPIPGLGGATPLPELGGPAPLPAVPAPGTEAPPRSLAPAAPLPGLGAAVTLPPAGTAPPAPMPRFTQQPLPPASPPAAPAARIVNVASATISRLYIARATEGIGREDWLGNAQITPGNAVQIRAPEGQGCVFNIRAVYVGGRTEDRPGVDVCAAPELRFEGGKSVGGASSR